MGRDCLYSVAIVQELGREVHEERARENDIVQGVEVKSYGTNWEKACSGVKSGSDPGYHHTEQPGEEKKGCLTRCWEH